MNIIKLTRKEFQHNLPNTVQKCVLSRYQALSRTPASQMNYDNHCLCSSALYSFTQIPESESELESELE